MEADDIHWIIGGLNAPTEPPLLPLDLPPSLRIDFLPAGQTLEAMLAAGELDALLSIYIPESFLRGAPHIERLFKDHKAVEQDYYRRTGIFPIMHTVVIRRDVHEKHPLVANALYRAFNQSKDVALKKMNYRGTLRYMLPWMTAELDDIDAVFGGDPWPYGVEANRPTLSALLRYLEEQGVIAKAPRVDELFVPVREMH